MRAGGAMAGSQIGQEVGARSARWQGREEMAGGKRARWQLLHILGQEGQMVGVMEQEIDGREPDGVGAVRQGGPDGWEGGDGRVHEGQMAVAGGSGGGMEQEFKMVGRQGLYQGVRGSSRPDRNSNGQRRIGYCRQDGGSGALGWDSRHMMGF